MHDWENLEFFPTDEEKQSRKGKIKVYLVIALIAVLFIGGGVVATVTYGWFGLFIWLFFVGLISAIAIGNNKIRYR